MYGAFYYCWTNYLCAKRIEAFGKQVDTTEVNDFKTACGHIAFELSRNETPYLRSYQSSTWPADNLPGVVSLRLHDKLFGDKFSATRASWLVRVKQRLDTKTGLIPHSVYADDGTPLQGARGCSQSLMNILLPEIDTSFAKEQYTLYKKHFVSTLLGLPVVREYPKGTFGIGDIDSGPVIFGVGGAAMVVGVGTLTKFNDKAIATAMRQTIEAFGVPITFAKEKRYVFGSVIVGDAFLLWAELQQPQHLDIEKETVTGWRLKFHLYSMLIFGVFCIPLAIVCFQKQ